MTAVYHEIKRAVIAQPENVSTGGADLTKITAAKADAFELDNEIDDVVEIRAWPLGYRSKFSGWYKDGILVSTENPYRFTVTEANKGTYVARFSTGHQFLRIQSKEKQRYIHAVSDQGSQSDFSALQLITGGELWLPGTIFHIEDWTVKGGHPYSYEVQGFNSASIYNTETGVYATMLQNTNDNTWLIFAHSSSFYMQDNGTENHVTLPNDPNEEFNKWYFEIIDKDLATHDKYFSIDPDELIQDPYSKRWFTTLRTSWNCRFADATHTNIKAYIVTGIDENDEMELTEVTGGIIPKGVPMLLECKTNSVEDNVMIPTTEAATFPATGNLLKCSAKYFDNQPKPESSTFRAFGVKNGKVGFVNEVTDGQLNGNRGYLVSDEDVMLPEMIQQVTLAQLVADGEKGGKYEVTDLTCAAVRAIDDDHTVLYCKDDDAVAQDERSVPQAGEIDYMARNGFAAADAYDQSHWMAVTIPGRVSSGYNPIGHRLTGVTGTLTDKQNPAFAASALPTVGEANPVTLNNYIVPSFAGTQNGTTSPDKTYFFVTPQVMEVATINWAQWDGGKFITPPQAGTVNQAGLSGEFYANFSYAEGSELIEGYPYSFTALLRSEPATTGSTVRAPRRAAGGARSLVAYPLEPLTVNREDGQVVTAVVQPAADSPVVSVRYVDMTGRVATRPWSGINIVVARHADGTTTATRTVK